MSSKVGAKAVWRAVRIRSWRFCITELIQGLPQRANAALARPALRRTYRPMTRRSPRTRAYAPDPDAPGRPCDYAGCTAAGEYRAPKSRSSLNEYWWFCLEHVRAYNATWDFYKGMTPGQIEAQMRDDTGWQRPTWPLGRLGAK